MSYLFCAFYCRRTLIVPIRSILALSSRWSQSVRGNRYFSVLSKVWPVIENSSLRFLDYEVVLHFKLLRYNRKLLIISEARRFCVVLHIPETISEVSIPHWTPTFMFFHWNICWKSPAQATLWKSDCVLPSAGENWTYCCCHAELTDVTSLIILQKNHSEIRLLKIKTS